MVSYYFFNEENIWVSDSLDLFEYKKGETDSNYFTYSTGEDKHRNEYKNPDFLSYSIDASEIMEDDWNQSKINWREVFWGFNKENIPLNGRLWIPDGNEKYPIVSIIHGNHSMQEFSDNGYNYIGEFLSSHGYIFNSVDQNFLNGSWDGDFRGKEMTTRSWHFLENLSYLKELSSDSLSPLYNKVDFNKIIFIGHSRGGEAVNLAAKFNNLSTFPDNGNVKFNYDFNIIGIVTLAPTDYRYSRNYELKNMNYLSLQGSMDSDEESFFGMRQSNRITNSIDTLVNTNILIEGANHSQFNTSWGNSDSGFPSKYLINYRNIIPDWLQRKILKYYLINFVNYVSGKDLNAINKLNKSVEYKISTDDELKILSQYQKASKNIKNDFEGNDIGNNENTTVFFENIDRPKLEKLEFRGGKSQQNKALKIKSKKNSRITFKLKNDSYLDNLSLDVYNEIDSSYLNIKFLIDNEIVDSTELKLINENEFAFCWIIDYPMFEINSDTKKIQFSHNPFSMPQKIDNIDSQNPLDMKAYQYDIVCNGVELSSGAIRNHKPDLMYKLFKIAGYDKDFVDKKFSGMINALKYGAPPHGGIAPGIDRLVMLLANEKNIREVTMFPMNQNAQDLMMNAPSYVSDDQLKELNIKLNKKN